MVIVIVALLWCGMILGISFLESWVKFKTPTLTKSVALDVGRTVFSAFNKAQFLILAILIILSFLDHLLLINWLIIIAISITLLLQVVWLFPHLCHRVDQIIAGNVVSKSPIHSFYGVLEILKLGLLLTLAVLNI